MHFHTHNIIQSLCYVPWDHVSNEKNSPSIPDSLFMESTHIVSYKVVNKPYKYKDFFTWNKIVASFYG